MQRRRGCAYQECTVRHRPRHPFRRPPKNPWRARGGGAKKIGDSLPPGRRRHRCCRHYSFGLGCGEVVYTSLKLLPGFSVHIYIYIHYTARESSLPVAALQPRFASLIVPDNKTHTRTDPPSFSSPLPLLLLFRSLSGPGNFITLLL